MYKLMFGVEDLDIRVRGGVAGVAVDDGLAETALDFLRFRFEHGRLVGDADAHPLGQLLDCHKSVELRSCRSQVAEP